MTHHTSVYFVFIYAVEGDIPYPCTPICVFRSRLEPEPKMKVEKPQSEDTERTVPEESSGNASF